MKSTLTVSSSPIMAARWRTVCPSWFWMSTWPPASIIVFTSWWSFFRADRCMALSPIGCFTTRSCKNIKDDTKSFEQKPEQKIDQQVENHDNFEQASHEKPNEVSMEFDIPSIPIIVSNSLKCEGFIESLDQEFHKDFSNETSNDENVTNAHGWGFSSVDFFLKCPLS